MKAAEAAVAPLEEGLHRREGGRVGERDLAPHRAKAGHEPPLCTEGAPWLGGEIEPPLLPPSPKNDPSDWDCWAPNALEGIAA